MGEKLVVGPINKGLKTDRTAFVIDNDSFPTLVNAYQWRGRIKRKRGNQVCINDGKDHGAVINNRNIRSVGGKNISVINDKVYIDGVLVPDVNDVKPSNRKIRDLAEREAIVKRTERAIAETGGFFLSVFLLGLVALALTAGLLLGWMLL